MYDERKEESRGILKETGASGVMSRGNFGEGRGAARVCVMHRVDVQWNPNPS